LTLGSGSGDRGFSAAGAGGDSGEPVPVLRPVTGAFQASAQWPEADSWPNIEQVFEREGRTRV